MLAPALRFWVRSGLGTMCSIGANAVVLIDVPSNSIAVGVPARVIPRKAAITTVNGRTRNGRTRRKGRTCMQELSESIRNRRGKADLPALSIVVIGRNEGARLAKCLDSIERGSGRCRKGDHLCRLRFNRWQSELAVSVWGGCDCGSPGETDRSARPQRRLAASSSPIWSSFWMEIPCFTRIFPEQPATHCRGIRRSPPCGDIGARSIRKLQSSIAFSISTGCISQGSPNSVAAMY